MLAVSSKRPKTLEILNLHLKKAFLNLIIWKTFTYATDFPGRAKSLVINLETGIVNKYSSGEQWR